MWLTFCPVRGQLVTSPRLCEFQGRRASELAGFGWLSQHPIHGPVIVGALLAHFALGQPFTLPFRDALAHDGRRFGATITFRPLRTRRGVWHGASCLDPVPVVGEEASVPPRIDTSPPVATITAPKEGTMMLATTLDSSLTLSAYATQWLARQSLNVRPRTAYLYAFVLRRYLLPVLGEVAITALSRSHTHQLLGVMAERQFAPNTVKSALAVLSIIAQDAIGEGLLTKSPTLGVRVSRQQPHRLVYDGAQLELFLTAANRAAGPLAPLLALCGKAGLRVGEAMGLQRQDVDLEARTLRIERTRLQSGATGPTKSGKPRLVDLCASLVVQLAPVVEAAKPWLFPGRRNHGPVSYNTVRAALRETARVAGLPPVSVHALRHGYASIMISNGVPISYVQRQLGHATIVLTNDYYGSHLPFERPKVLEGW